MPVFVFALTSLQAYDYNILQEEEFSSCLQELAELRIKVFREYPYLYEGNLEYEKNYLNQYIATKNSVLIAVKDGERMIGAITGMPLDETWPDCKSFFVDKKIPIKKSFYLGEIILLKEYRREGIGARMYELFEKFVRESKKYTEITLCEIVSPNNDPRRPGDYFCLDNFWTKRGYVKNPDWVIQFSWKEVDSQEESYHPLVFWRKTL